MKKNFLLKKQKIYFLRSGIQMATVTLITTNLGTEAVSNFGLKV